MTFIERRLYFHVDWLLLGAVLRDLPRSGIAMIYSTTYVTTRPAPRLLRLAALRARPRPHRAARLPVDRLPDAGRTFALHLRRARGAAAVRAALRRGRGGARSAGFRSGVVQPAAVGVRPTRASRSCSRCTSARTAAAPATTAICRRRRVFTVVPLLLIAKQPDLGTAVTLLPVFLGIAYPRRAAAAAPRHHRARGGARWRRSRGSSR